jgi:hypothetical protein
MKLILSHFFNQLTDDKERYGHFIQENQSRYKGQASEALASAARS